MNDEATREIKRLRAENEYLHSKLIPDFRRTVAARLHITYGAETTDDLALTVRVSRHEIETARDPMAPINAMLEAARMELALGFGVRTEYARFEPVETRSSARHSLEEMEAMIRKGIGL